MTSAGSLFTVVAESSEDLSLLQSAFMKCKEIPPVKKNYAKMIGGGVAKVLTMPWKLTNMVVVSLEVVSIHVMNQSDR